MKKTKSIRPSYVAALVLIVAIAVWLNLPSETPAGPPKPLAKKTLAKDGADEYTVEDKTATFTETKATPVDSFQPVVYPSRGGGSVDENGQNITADQIPADFAGGESNWVFSGTADIDNQRNAFIENKNTKESVTLIRGQRWKSAVVTSIGESSITMSGPSGTKKMDLVSVVEGGHSEVASNPDGSGGNAQNGGLNQQNAATAPMALSNNGLSGPIGNVDPGSISVTADSGPAINFNGGGRGGRRGGRNRRGGGFGGGNGGN